MKLKLARFFGREAAIPVMVVQTAPFDPPPKTEACRVILDHWQALRGDRL